MLGLLLGALNILIDVEDVHHALQGADRRVDHVLAVEFARLELGLGRFFTVIAICLHLHPRAIWHADEVLDSIHARLRKARQNDVV